MSEKLSIFELTIILVEIFHWGRQFILLLTKLGQKPGFMGPVSVMAPTARIHCVGKVSLEFTQFLGEMEKQLIPLRNSCHRQEKRIMMCPHNRD